MAYETLADTGLTPACYGGCPNSNFPALALRIERTQNDVELATEAGLSEQAMQLLRRQAAEATETGKHRASKAAGICALGHPWECPAGNVCGDTQTLTVQTVILDRHAKTGSPLERLTFQRPAPDKEA